MYCTQSLTLLSTFFMGSGDWLPAQIELWFTLAFAVDIIIRLLVCLPNPSDFLKSRKNMVDLFLVVTTLIIQIPPIRRSHVYMYLTVFQVLRIYRPIIYIERLRSLIVSLYLVVICYCCQTA